MAIKKILLVRFSSIGDILLTTPVIRCLKHQYPHAELYYLTKKEYAYWLAANPNITRVITLEKSLIATIAALKKIGFDCIIDLHKNQRTLLIRAFFPFTPSFSHDKLTMEKWWFTCFKVNILPKKHLVDRYFEGLERLGVQNDYAGLDFFIPPERYYDIKSLPEPFQNGYIVYSIGGNHATKRMPVEKWLKLASLVPYPTIVLAGTEARTDGSTIARFNDHVMNLCGTTDMFQSASIIKQSKLVVTHDTGLMHLAAAFKKPVITIWGNTTPQFGMYSYYGKNPVINHHFEVNGLKCRPCSKLGYNRCPKRHFACMTQQNIIRIADTVHELLRQL